MPNSAPNGGIAPGAQSGIASWISSGVARRISPCARRPFSRSRSSTQHAGSTAITRPSRSLTITTLPNDHPDVCVAAARS